MLWDILFPVRKETMDNLTDDNSNILIMFTEL